MLSDKRKLNINYSSVQALYWMLSGVIFGFTTVFLQHKDFSNSEVGIVLALGNIFGFLLQPIIAGAIDRKGNKTLFLWIYEVVAISAIIAFLTFILPMRGIVLSAAFIIMIAGNILLQPLCISLCFYIESRVCSINFSSARAIGSLFYSVCTLSLGFIVEKLGPDTVPLSYLILSVIFGLLTLRSTLLIRRFGHHETEGQDAVSDNSSGIIEFLRENKRFCLFLIATSMLFFTHGLIGNFMIEFIRNVGGNSSDLGGLLAFMALCEVPVMLLFQRISKKFSCSSILRFAVIMFTIKELMIYLAPNVTMIYLGELFQALSFALFVPASVLYVNKTVSKSNSAKGQAFVTSMITLGNIFASLIGGRLLDSGGASFTLLVGVIVSGLGTIIMLPAIKKC